MRRWLSRAGLILLALVAIGVVTLAAIGVPNPPSFQADNVPRISWKWAWQSVSLVRRFQTQRNFAAWYGAERRMLISIGTGRNVHIVSGPGAEPQRLEGLPAGASFLRSSQDVPRPYVVYSLDEGGSERYRFFRFDLDTHLSTPLTDKAARAYPGGLDRQGRRFCFSSNERNGTDSDIYVVDVLNPASKKMVSRATGDYEVWGWTADDRLVVSRYTSVDRQQLSLLNPDDGSLQPIAGNDASFRVAAVTRDRRVARHYIGANLEGEYTNAYAIELTTQQTTPLAQQISRDIVDMTPLSDGRTLALLVNDDARYVLYLADTSGGQARRVEARLPGFPVRVVAHPTLPLIALDVIGLDGTSGVWTYEVASDRFEPWSVAPTSETATEPEVTRYPTFDAVDGKPRTVPVVIVKSSSAPPGPRPVIIDIHGGPPLQSLAVVQPQDLLVLQEGTLVRPNVRGSSGYGRTYETLDDRERREDAIKDIGALLDWIATRPDFDSTRIGVTGASYGGYMVLETLVRYSSRVRCGMDLFGISDLPTFLEESEHGHFPEAQRGEYGDARDPRDLRFLELLSPARFADQIRVPLLIYQGGNDVRVKPAQSRAMVERIRKAGGRVTYIEVPNEGHGMDQPMTQFYVGVAASEFMQRCLNQ